MAATATTDVINALKYTYGADRVLYIASQEVPLWNVLYKTKRDVGGRGQFIMPILKQNPGAWTGIAQGGALPATLSPATTEASYALKEFTGIYEVSWKLIQDSRTSKFAFQQAIQMMDDGLRRRIFRLLNADLLGTGRGELAAISSAQNSTTPTVNYLPRLEPGLVVDWVAVSDDNTLRANSVTVNSVDAIARTVTLSGALSGSAASDYATVSGTVSTAVGSLHMNGMLGVLDSVNPNIIWSSGNSSTNIANIGNIDRGASPAPYYWITPKFSNGGTLRTLTEDLLLQAEDGVREKGGAKLSHWFMNLAIGRRYHELLRADTYFALGDYKGIEGGIGRVGGDGQQAKPEGEGKSPYKFSGIDVYFDPFFQANTVIGFDKSHFFIGVGENELPAPISDVFDNVPFFRQTNNATFQVAWYWQGQLLTDNPCAGAKIIDIAES